MVTVAACLIALPWVWDRLSRNDLEPITPAGGASPPEATPAEANLAPPGGRPRTVESPPPGKRGPVLPLGSTEIFVKGMRALLQYLEAGDADALKRAAAHFTLASEKEAGVRASGAEFAQIKYRMYQAYTHERLGNRSYKELLIKSGAVSEGNYQFYFHTKLKKLSDVVMMHLQLEDELFMRHIHRALERYAKDNAKRFPTSLGAMVPRYLDHIPLDPACPDNNYAKRYALTDGGRSFSLTACDNFELAGKTSRRKKYNAEREYKVYHMVVGAFLQSDRLDTFLPLLLKYSGLKHGEVVADVGSGPGMFTFPFAKAVGPKGKVIAVDINRSVLAYIRFIAARLPELNVEVRHSESTDVGLPASSVDVAFVIQTYHAMLDFSEPDNAKIYQQRLLPWLTSIRKMLKPGGRLVIQEGLKKISTKLLQKQVVGAGFKLVTIKTGEPKDGDIIAVFKKP